MLNSIRVLAILSTLLIIGCASGPSRKTFDSAIGVWNVRYEIPYGSPLSSKLTIIDETGGTYSHLARVEFYAIDEQRNWKGYWTLETGFYACLEKKNGSIYWGESMFQFNETYNEYTGTWNFCGEEQKFATKGVR
jgi:hypothetical protein